MARRRRLESSAVGHTTPPVYVVDENPMANHPGLTPLENKRIKRVAGKGKRTAKVSVKVQVDATHGDAA